MPFNIILQEAAESKELNTERVAKDIKKQLNTCKLTKYSRDACSKFYSSFFLQSIEDASPTVSDWGAIYTKLLSEDKFCEDLTAFMITFRPSIYEGLFIPLWAEIQSEASRRKNDRIRYLQLTKAMLTMLQSRMAGVANMIKSQISDINTLKFSTTVEQTLSKMCFDIQALINMEVAASVTPDDVTYARNVATAPLSESMQGLLDLLENCNVWYDEFMLIEMAKSFNDVDRRLIESVETGTINEGLGEDAAMKIKEAKLAQKKAERNFDELVMKKIREIREERRNAKHAEMVGESLRVMREIKRILKVAPIALLSPIAAAVIYLCSIFYDRATDRKDRKILVDQLKDEMEITNEKIQMAERNGDDKARIELIRFRQKLEHEYERIMRVRYDAQTASKYV